MATGGGTTWEKKEGWLEGDPCVDKWYGVSCSYSTLSGWNVSSLGLRNNGLTGTLPSSLSNSLPHLSSIDFRNNSLSGPLPPLTDLENLSTLHLDTNSLSGSLPPFPPNLQYLSCDFNEFSGTFPKFSTRQGMSCSNNMFTRAERISVSKDLDLSHNHFNNFSDFYGKYDVLEGRGGYFTSIYLFINLFVIFFFFFLCMHPKTAIIIQQGILMSLISHITILMSLSQPLLFSMIICKFISKIITLLVI